MTEQAAVLALVRHARAEWYLVSQLLEFTGSAARVLRGEWTGLEPPELLAAVAETDVTEADVEECAALIDKLAAEGVSLVTVLDDDYPTNLRLIYNRPPFLFVRGTLTADDDRSLAVVGTRRASDEGLAVADRFARGSRRGRQRPLRARARDRLGRALGCTRRVRPHRRGRRHRHPQDLPARKRDARRAHRRVGRRDRLAVLARRAADDMVVPAAQRDDERDGSRDDRRRGLPESVALEPGAARP